MNSPDLNVFTSISNTRLLDVVAGVFYSSIVILHRRTLLLLSQTILEVRNSFYMSRHFMVHGLDLGGFDYDATHDC